MPRAKSEHYVDNKRLYEEMKNYLDAVKEARSQMVISQGYLSTLENVY